MSKVKCPIKGCNLAYASSVIGWHRHVASVATHPYWHPEVEDSDERMSLYRAEFPEFFPHTNGNGNGGEHEKVIPLGRKRLVQLLEAALGELRAI